MASFVLNDLVEIEENVIKIGETAIFECNSDALAMLTVMYEFTQHHKPFSAIDILERLDIDQTEDNVFAVQNAINYLRGCFIVNEY